MSFHRLEGAQSCHEHRRRAVHHRTAGRPDRAELPDDPLLVRLGTGPAGRPFGQALAGGVVPGSPEGQAVLDRLVPPAERAATLRQLEMFTDARVERYWQLLGMLNGQPPFPPAVPAFEWLIAALREGS